MERITREQAELEIARVQENGIDIKDFTESLLVDRESLEAKVKELEEIKSSTERVLQAEILKVKELEAELSSYKDNVVSNAYLVRMIEVTCAEYLHGDVENGNELIKQILRYLDIVTITEVKE